MAMTPILKAPGLLDCLICGERLGKVRRTVRTGTLYCSPKCAAEAARRRNGVIRQFPDLSASKVGAISELVVTADLLAKGFDVFRALSPAASCDLAIVRD